MKIGAQIDGDLAQIMAAEIRGGEKAVTRGVSEAGKALKAEWRGQITGSGLGQRLANTVRSHVYPEGEDSLRAAALVWTKAPDIIHAFDRGVLIRSRNGFWLAIPLPTAGVFGLGRKRITPGGWEARTGLRLRFIYRRRGPSLLVADNARITSRGMAAEKRGRRRRDGMLTGAQTVPIFLLIPQVKLPKKLDIDRLAGAALARLPGAILANWPDKAE